MTLRFITPAGGHRTDICCRRVLTRRGGLSQHGKFVEARGEIADWEVRAEQLRIGARRSLILLMARLGPGPKSPSHVLPSHLLGFIEPWRWGGVIFTRLALFDRLLLRTVTITHTTPHDLSVTS
jgi:hypothetical protein